MNRPSRRSLECVLATGADFAESVLQREQTGRGNFGARCARAFCVLYACQLANFSECVLQREQTEREKGTARNALETFVYSMRAALEGKHKEHLDSADVGGTCERCELYSSTCTLLYVCTYIYTCVYICVYTYLFTHIYSYTCIHIHI